MNELNRDQAKGKEIHFWFFYLQDWVLLVYYEHIKNILYLSIILITTYEFE